jgi:uncharacterized protein
MICPACGRELVAITVEGMVVDACRGGCGGIWFDNFELDKVDEANERLGEALVAIEFDPNVTVEDTRRNCPKCIDVVLMKHKFSPGKAVLVDECPKCGGVWLDGGELSLVRRKAPSPEDRRPRNASSIASSSKTLRA